MSSDMPACVKTPDAKELRITSIRSRYRQFHTLQKRISLLEMYIYFQNSNTTSLLFL